MVTKPITLQEAREWGLEAARTSLRLNVITGPGSFGNNRPPCIHDGFARSGRKVSWSDYDIQNTQSVRVPPSAGQTGRMEQFYTAMATHLNENERKELHRYLGARITKRLSVVSCGEKTTSNRIFSNELVSM